MDNAIPRTAITQAKYEFDLSPGKAVFSSSENYYRCLQPIGEGGNSSVFLVCCSTGTNYGNLFALKIFKRLADSKRLERFKMETDFLMTTNHPSIMRIYDEGTITDREGKAFPFVVTEYLPEQLAKQIRNNEISVQMKVSYAMQLLSALNYIQGLKRPVIHRDIKPDNIFITGKSCIIGDFGLMKFLDSKETEQEIESLAGYYAMPFNYPTPDLIQYANNTKPLTVSTDIFQLGLVLCELFTGVNPVKNIKQKKNLEHLKNIKSPPIKLTYGKEIKSAIDKMLSYDSEDRPDIHALLDEWFTIFKKILVISTRINGKVL